VIRVLFTPEGNQVFDPHFQALLSRESSHYFDVEGLCLTNKGQCLPCSVHCFQMGHDRYIVIISDLSRLLKARHAAEEAKQQTERLISACLPAQVSARLESG